MRPLHLILPLCCLASPLAFGQVPTYRVEPISTYTTVTTVSAANELGQVVGWQIVASQAQPYIATEASGLSLLPLPTGYVSGSASDINDSGVIVGAVSGLGFPEPAIWTPNASGGYDVTIPEQFVTLQSPLGELPITGGQAVAISNNGAIVGWSTYQGFQGGPTTRFSLTGPPTNLGALGFAATVTAINDNDVIVGGGLRMDLDTGVVTNLGVPPQSGGGPHYTFVIAYAVNDQNETVVAAQQATAASNWVTFFHNDAVGFTQLKPGIVPSPFVGVYDNNDQGDIAASGGVLFAAEGVLVGSFDGLLDPASAHWDTSLGKIANDRRVYTTAQDTLTGSFAIVQLVPIGPGDNVYCTAKTSSAGCLTSISTSSPGGQPASGASDTTVTATQVQEGKNGLLFGGLSGPASLPFNGGTLCVLPPTKRGPITNSGGNNPNGCGGSYSTLVNDGNVLPSGLDAGPGNSGWYQYWYRDPLNGAGGLGTALSNAVQLDFQ